MERKEEKAEQNCYAPVALKKTTTIFYELKPWKMIMMTKYSSGNITLHRGHSGTDVRLFHVWSEEPKTLDLAVILQITKFHACLYHETKT